MMTDEVIGKIEHCLTIGGTITDCCLFANISPSAFYNWLAKHPDYKERIEVLRRNPILKAKQTVYDSICDGDEVTAKWLLEHRANDEFNSKQSVEVQTSGSLSIEERSDALDGFLKRFDID